MRIGLSYHGGDHDYEAYANALHRRAQALGMPIEVEWLAGRCVAARPQPLARIDALLLTGGPDVEPHRYGMPGAAALCRTSPERDAAEWTLLERWREHPIPTLAICRGAQLLNVFHGGTLIPDLGEHNETHKRDNDERRRHKVSIETGTRLHGIVGAPAGIINSSHHQAVDRLAPGFRVAAWSDDGVIEAFEPAANYGPFLLAVQWHPEAMEPGSSLADGVLDALLTAQH